MLFSLTPTETHVTASTRGNIESKFARFSIGLMMSSKLGYCSSFRDLAH